MENNKVESIRDWLRRWGWTCLIVMAISALILAVGWHYWCSIWTFILLDFSENNGERSRNIVLIVAAIIGLPLAFWRSLVAAQQANTSERGLQNDRFQKGAEMLGSGVLVVRMGGVVALERLASDQPVEYHIQIMNLLCAFIRHPSEDASHVGASAATNEGDDPKCRPDVELAAQVLGRRSDAQCKIERKNEWLIDLRDAKLSGAKLSFANLCDARLNRSDLSGINLVGAKLRSTDKLRRTDLGNANLNDASLTDADLSRANLLRADLTNAGMFETNLTGADMFEAILDSALLKDANLTNTILRNVQGLTQKQLNTAKASKDSPPFLTNSLCAETGDPLVWGGTALED